MHDNEISLRRMRTKLEEARHCRSSRRLKANIDDQNLPHLSLALDPERMRAAFEEFFKREYPDRGLTVNEVYVGKIYLKPGKNCEIPYGVHCHDHEGKTYFTLFQGKISANGKGHNKACEAAPNAWPGCGFWKPVTFWPEMGMVLTTFPYDPKLPYLGQLTEPEFIKQQVEASLSGFGLPVGTKCLQVTCQRVKHFPGKRCVLRYELLVMDAVGSQRQLVFYGKTYNNATSRYVYEVIRRIYASSAYANGLLNIPAPIAHLDDANTIWLHAWEGNNFSAVAEELGWSNLPGSGYLPKIASMLAALHQVKMPAALLGSGPSLSRVIENAWSDVNDIMAFLPEKQPALENTVKTLESLVPKLEAKTPRTTIHGTFKIGQILCRHNEVGLVDFDSIACGDPHYDIAEFLSSLVYLQLSDQVPAAVIAESVEIFLTGYAQQVPWGCDHWRIAWYLVPFLLGKIHSSLKRGEPAAVENMPLAFALVEEWLDFAKR